MRATFKKALVALGVFMCSAFLVYGAGNTSGILLKSSPYTAINATSDAALLKLIGSSGALVLDGIVTKVKTKAETKAGTPRDASIYNSYIDNYLSLVDDLDDATKTAYGSDYSAIFQYIYPRVYALKVEDKSATLIGQLQNYVDSATGNSGTKSITSVTTGTSTATNSTASTTTNSTASTTTNSTASATSGTKTASSTTTTRECTGTMPALGEGMQVNYYNGITVGPATPNTTWKFSAVADSCTVSCKSGYKQDGSKESCIKKPDYGTVSVTVYTADGNIAKSAGNISITVECLSPSKLKQLGAYIYSGYYPFWSTSNGVANIYPSRCAEEGDDAIIYAKYGSVIGKSVTVAEILKNPSLSLDTGKGYSFSYSNPYLARVLMSVTGLGAGAKMCAGGVGTCQDASKYVVPPTPWVYDGNSDTWSFSQDVDWHLAGTEYFDFGLMKNGSIVKVESIHYTGYPTNNRPSAAALGYCPNGQTVAGPCTGIDVAIDNNSGDGHLRLTVHTPTKSGWKGCASPGGCNNLATDYSSAQSPYENNSAWTWNESAKTWSCDIYWPDLPTGTYSIGVANDRYVFKTISVNWVKP